MSIESVLTADWIYIVKDVSEPPNFQDVILAAFAQGEIPVTFVGYQNEDTYFDYLTNSEIDKEMNVYAWSPMPKPPAMSLRALIYTDILPVVKEHLPINLINELTDTVEEYEIDRARTHRLLHKLGNKEGQ